MSKFYFQSTPLLIFYFLFFIPTASSAQSAWRSENYKRFNHNNYNTFPYFDSLVNADRFDHELLNAAVFFETNKQRIKNGLSPLKHHPKLEMSAQGHSKDMVVFNFFSHTSRVPGKASVSDRVKKTGLYENYVGENIFDHSILNFNGNAYYSPSYFGFFKSATTGNRIQAFIYKTLAEALVSGWMNSPGHRANILNTNYTHMGMGNFPYYKGLGIDEIPYIKSTQNFARIETIIASSSKRTSSANYSTNKIPKPTTIGITAGAANVFSNIDNLANGHYQAILHLGVLKGEKGYGQNFYGMFSSLDLGNGFPICIETGFIMRRFFRLSAGFQYGPDTKKNARTYQLVPSLTTGFRINLSNIFIDLNLNAYGNYQNPETRFITAIGFSF